MVKGDVLHDGFYVMRGAQSSNHILIPLKFARTGFPVLWMGLIARYYFLRESLPFNRLRCISRDGLKRKARKRGGTTSAVL